MLRPRAELARNFFFDLELKTGRALGFSKTCENPIWLRARGTRKWSLRFKRSLPAGKYVIYSRAVSASEQSFTRKDGNRAEVRAK